MLSPGFIRPLLRPLLLPWLRPLLGLLLVAVSLALSACSGPGSSPRSAPLAGRSLPPPQVLTSDWLGGGSSLRREHFERLLDLVAQDPEAISLVEKAADTLGHRSPGQLFDLLSVCKDGVSEDSGGHTTFNFDLGVFSLDLESLASGKLSAQAQGQLNQVLGAPELMRWARQDFPDYVLVRRSSVPRICLARGMDVVSAYETLLHELTHASVRDPHFAPKKASQTDEMTFLEAWILAPGDEVDAYIAGSRARIRLEKGRSRMMRQLQRFFDDQGNLTSTRELLARAIMAPAPVGLNYAAASLRGIHAQTIDAERAELRTRLNVATTTLDMRRQQREALSKNIGVHQHNISVHQRNAEAARAHGDDAAQQRSLALAKEAVDKAEEARRNLPLAEASLQRLEQECAKLQAGLAALDRR